MPRRASVPRRRSFRGIEIHWLLLMLSLLAQRSTPWPVRSERGAPTVVWEEEEEPPTDDVDPPGGGDAPERRRKRDLLWLFGPPQRRRGATGRAAAAPAHHPAAHPLRTERWELAVHWRNGTADRPSARRGPRTSPLFVDFAANGYLRATPENRTGRRRLHGGGYWAGQWEIAPSGLRCRLNETLLLHADLHLNPFGRHPRLTRGVIVDTARTGWRGRRPVVGTFTGRGVGQDTVDLSYKRRR